MTQYMTAFLVAGQFAIYGGIKEGKVAIRYRPRYKLLTIAIILALHARPGIEIHKE
jgi:hypothetical protein